MKIRTTSNAPGYVRKFQRVLVASAIATFLGACAGGTDEETGNGGIAGTTPDIGAAVEATVNTDTDSIDIGSGTDVEVTTDTDSTGVDSVEITEGAQTDVEVDSTTDVVVIPEVDSTTDTVVIPEVDSTTDTVVIPEVESTNSVPDNALGLIQSHPDLGLFATAIQSTILVDYLADPEQQVTVFALSDKAFESLSTIQRDALFNDTARLETLVRSTTIPDRIPESAAGVVGDMQPLANERLRLEREGDLISVTVAGDASPTLISPPVYSIEVTDSLGNGKAAIHIIDDFINIGTTFFPPDPGSIMDSLLTDEASTISNRIRYTRWYRELGNSEGEWTVFVPLYSVNSYDIEPYIVAGTVNDPIIGEAGAFTSVDGSSHVIENVNGALTIDDIDISEINALQVNNGHVHRIAWPIGANATDVSTVYDTVFNSADHTYLTMLINRANLADILDDPYRDYTLFAPDNAAFDAIESAAPGTLESMSPDDLGRFLQYHIVVGTYDSSALVEVISLSPTGDTSALQSLVVDGLLTFTVSAEAGSGIAVNDVAITAADLLPEVAEGEATTGIVHSIGAVLTPPPIDIDPVDPSGSDSDTGTFATLVGTDFSIAVAALDAAFGAGTFDNAAWTLFLPSDAVLAAASPAITALTAEQINGHLHTAALDEAGLAAVIAAYGGTGTILSANNNGANNPTSIAVTDNAGDTEVGGFAVTYIGVVPADEAAGTTGGAQVYSIDGIFPEVE